MVFYIESNQDVANYLKTFHKSGYGFVIQNTFNNNNNTIISVNSIEDLKHSHIPEYKLHQKYGLIAADNKLFKGASSKEQKEQQMRQQKETKKTFEVGDECVIKNVNNRFYVAEETTENFVDKEVTIVSKFTIRPVNEDSDINMVSVMDEDGQCICFREEMCYHVKTEKDIFVENLLVDFNVSYMSNKELAEKLYEAGYRKVGE